MLRMSERGNVIMRAIVRRAFERIENGLKTAIISARNGQAAESFEKSSEHRGSLRSDFLLQSFQSSATEFLGHLIGPE